MTDASISSERDVQGRRLLSLITRTISVVLLVPIIVLVPFVVTTPLTISGILYFIGAGMAVVGMGGVAWGYPRLRRILWLGLGLIIVVFAVRWVLIRNNTRIQQFILPEQNTLCLINCIFEEQDVALISTRLLPLIGWISPAEESGLMDAMYAGYQAMAAAQSFTPSPFVRTYLSLQSPTAFDTVIIEPESNQPAQMGLIFLHGFTGNFTMPCWLMAQTVRTINGITVCPSVGWRGDWWTAQGEATLRIAINYLHQRGVNRIYLAGLSNGAVGASELAYKLTADIAGLILISGASLDARDSGLPVLVFAGRDDERMPAPMLRTYADQMGSKATFVQFEADHFMLAKKYQDVQAQITVWLLAH